ncbi:MAG: cytochrome P460 family protein [Chloroflexi bacterium]|nr:cytochrome P460 family protein [Chloroflexota bacterium]
MVMRIVSVVALAALVVSACSGSESPDLPDPVGSAVWNYLQDVEYQDNWTLWPGKGELYEGGEPHGMLFTTYLSPPAIDALTDKAGSMPAGAFIIKENYTADAVLAALTVMYKVDGFNPEHNDWFFAKIAADGEVVAEGQVEGCQACHGAAAANDYVLTASLK